MIDKILDLKDDMPLDVYNEIINEAIKSGDARTLFMLAYFIKNANVIKLGEEILKTNNLRYISFFMRSIPNINKEKFLNKVLELGSERDAYYCLFDNRDLEDEQVFKLMEKCRTSQKYYYLSIYHYFITLDRFDIKLFSKVCKYLSKIDVSISEDNYKETLKALKEKEFSKIAYDDNNYFSKNCYVGRKE